MMMAMIGAMKAYHLAVCVQQYNYLFLPKPVGNVLVFFGERFFDDKSDLKYFNGGDDWSSFNITISIILTCL